MDEKAAYTKLQLAAAQGNFETLLRELEGADPEYVNELSTQDGNAALHYVAKLLDNPADKGVLQALVAKGAKVNMQNVVGETALLRAVINNRIFVAEYLLENGATVNICNSRGQSCMDFAVLRKDARLIRLLLEHGSYVAESALDLDWYSPLVCEYFETRMEATNIAQRIAQLFHAISKAHDALAEKLIVHLRAAFHIVRTQWGVEEQVGISKVIVGAGPDQVAAVLDAVSRADIPLHSTLDPDSIEKGSVVGRGASSMVYKGKVNGHPCVIKQLVGVGEKQFIRETNTLTLMFHPNIVRILGVVQDDTDRTIILEYVERGDLDALLQSNKELTEMDKFDIAIGVLRAIAHLHTMGIIHRDIKPENILMSENMTPKLADCGVSRTVNHDMSGSIGSPGFIAPEVLASEPYSFEADIYSYGMLLYELVTRKHVFDEFSPYQVPWKVSKGVRPEFPKGTPKSWQRIIKSCWHARRSKRPTAMELISILISTRRAGVVEKSKTMKRKSKKQPASLAATLERTVSPLISNDTFVVKFPDGTTKVVQASRNYNVSDMLELLRSRMPSGKDEDVALYEALPGRKLARLEPDESIFDPRGAPKSLRLLNVKTACAEDVSMIVQVLRSAARMAANNLTADCIGAKAALHALVSHGLADDNSHAARIINELIARKEVEVVQVEHPVTKLPSLHYKIAAPVSSSGRPRPILSDVQLCSCSIDLFELDPVELARQLVCFDHDTFCSLHVPGDFQNLTDQKLPRLAWSMEWSNRFCAWVATSILHQPTLEMMVDKIKLFLTLCEEAYKLRGFSIVCGISLTLSGHALSRISPAWKALPKRYVRIKEDMEDLCTPVGNFQRLRAEMDSAALPYLPFLPVFLKDLTLIEVGNDDDEEKNVLCMPIYERLSRIVAVPYELERVFFVQQQLVAIDGVDSESQDLLSDVACAKFSDGQKPLSLPTLETYSAGEGDMRAAGAGVVRTPRPVKQSKPLSPLVVSPARVRPRTQGDNMALTHDAAAALQRDILSLKMERQAQALSEHSSSMPNIKKLVSDRTPKSRRRKEKERERQMEKEKEKEKEKERERERAKAREQEKEKAMSLSKAGKGRKRATGDFAAGVAKRSESERQTPPSLMEEIAVAVTAVNRAGSGSPLRHRVMRRRSKSGSFEVGENGQLVFKPETSEWTDAASKRHEHRPPLSPLPSVKGRVTGEERRAGKAQEDTDTEEESSGTHDEESADMLEKEHGERDGDMTRYGGRSQSFGEDRPRFIPKANRPKLCHRKSLPEMGTLQRPTLRRSSVRRSNDDHWPSRPKVTRKTGSDRVSGCSLLLHLEKLSDDELLQITLFELFRRVGRARRDSESDGELAPGQLPTAGLAKVCECMREVLNDESNGETEVDDASDSD